MVKYVSVIGGVNVDIKGFSADIKADADSHPGKVFFSAGGVARNMAENLSRLDLPVRLFGITGKDVFGEFIFSDCASREISTEFLMQFSQVRTSVYVTLANKTGSAFFAVNDMKSAEEFLNADLIKKNSEVLKQSSMIVLDTNMKTDALNEAVEIANENSIPVFVDAVSSEKALRVKEISGKVDFLSVNRAEFAGLFENINFDKDEKILKLMNDGAFEKFKYVILKMDKEGVKIICTEEEIIFSFKALQTEIKEISGAGDAFNAGFIFSVLNDESGSYDITKAGRMGLCAAGFALRSYDSVSNEINKKSLTDFYNQILNSDEFI
ncbi:MAG: hypothetical protein IPM38_06125 [Ignavibacteria bacterium]|nr:hypothetical protein [Ignavibacteria bacterium]